jgi:hypothetical protein
MLVFFAAMFRPLLLKVGMLLKAQCTFVDPDDLMAMSAEAGPSKEGSV